MSENIGKVSEEQGPSNASPKFTKKSRIFVSDTEVSLLEININSPSFRNISIEANIPEQQRLRILSSKSENKKEISRPINFIFMKKKQLPTALSPVVANIFQHPPPETQALPLQVPVSHATSATNRAANAKIIDKRCKKIIEMECECGCGKRDVIDDKLELERMISLFSHQKGEGKAVAKLFISKRNQWGETEISREIAIPHPIEVLEKQMGKFYTQSFPLEAQITNDDPLHGLEESDEDEEIEVVENRDDKPSVPESIQNVENVQPKMLKTKIIFPTPKSYSKCKPDHETLKTSGFINEMSENIGK
ncbi:cyclin domain-containing protein, partial [Wuchereria bancrofti]